MLVKVVYPRDVPGGDHKEFVVEVESPDVEGALEETFRKMNVVDGTELPVELGCRSMSCGDLIMARGRWFVCEPMGWREVPAFFAYPYIATSGTFAERSFGVDAFVKANPGLRHLLAA
jgi:hypothetical protein